MLLQPKLPSETEIDGLRPVLGQCLMASSQGPELFISAGASHQNMYQGGCVIAAVSNCCSALCRQSFLSLPPLQIQEINLF